MDDMIHKITELRDDYWRESLLWDNEYDVGNIAREKRAAAYALNQAIMILQGIQLPAEPQAYQDYIYGEYPK